MEGMVRDCGAAPTTTLEIEHGPLAGLRIVVHRAVQRARARDTVGAPLEAEEADEPLRDVVPDETHLVEPVRLRTAVVAAVGLLPGRDVAAHVVGVDFVPARLEWIRVGPVAVAGAVVVAAEDIEPPGDRVVGRAQVLAE